MTKPQEERSVTILRCGRCGRSGDVALHDGRFWCGICGDWAVVELERVRDVRVEREAGQAALAPVPFSPEGLRLQPLRIPMGWVMDYNNALYEIDPDPERIPAEDRWWIFKQDMLQMVHPRQNRLLDLGWEPEGDLVDGVYKLVLYEGDFNGELLHDFKTQHRAALVAEIERLLDAVSYGRDVRSC